MKKALFIAVCLLSATLLSLHSCTEADDPGCGAINISAAGGTESHHTGDNCMSCHVDGGGGSGCFIIAGTVYDSTKTTPYANALIKLFTEPDGDGQLKATITGDAMGNFYTTTVIDFGTGLYPVVFGTSGEVSDMSGSVTGGSCNACHGKTVEKIYLKQ